jgi:hypothetical protein
VTERESAIKPAMKLAFTGDVQIIPIISVYVSFNNLKMIKLIIILIKLIFIQANLDGPAQTVA